MNLRLTNSIFAFLLLFQTALYAQEPALPFKAGSVDVQKVFKSYYKTTETQADINKERARIKTVDNEGRLMLTGLKKEIQVLQQQSQMEGVSVSKLEELEQELKKITQRHKRMDAKRQSRFGQANASLDRQMRGKMKGILSEIHELVRQHAEAEGFTIVFEKSGTNTNQMTPMLYGKEVLDITAVLMLELNKNRPDER